MQKQKIFTLSSLLCLGLLLPAPAFAAPENVSNIRAVSEGDTVRVLWDTVLGDVAQYKIFWSRESILENDALYDDVVDTKSPVTEFVLEDLPASDELFVTVLAVSSTGEESPLFEEEARVSRTIATASSSVPAPMAPPPPVVPDIADVSGDAGTEVLWALKAESLSATGVLLTFSAPVLLDADAARNAFTITSASGQTLAIYRIKTLGNTVELHTVPQVRNRAYRIAIGEGVRGRTETGDQILSLDPGQTDLLFLGHGNGIAAPVETVAGTAGDVGSVTVKAGVDGINTYVVEVSWLAPQTGTVTGYKVAQTRDGGKTYGPPMTLEKSVQSVRIPKTPAGEIGLLVQAIDESGNLSRGVLQRIILPSTKGGVTGQITPGSMPRQNSPLPQTGAGTMTLLGIAGACAGAQVLRRRKQAA